MRGHGTALAHLLFLAARRRPHEFGLHGCLLRSHPLTLPTAPISFNFLAVNDIAPPPATWLVPPLGTWGSGDCDRSCNKSAPCRKPHTLRHARQAPPCDTGRLRAAPALPPG